MAFGKMFTGALNRFLDSLPRTTFGRYVREVPAFRSCGVVGFYVAVIATMSAGLLTGGSLLVLATLSAVCALSFFGFAYLRMWISGQQNLVLLEHVWVALISCAVCLWLLDLPVLRYADDVAIGLSFFLAAGRIGCFLAGCCYGFPAGVGVVYGRGHATEGFPSYLVGVRLFPVQLTEAAALALIGVGGLALIRNTPPGTVLTWYLVTYSVLRFGLEGLRADERPHFAGLSQSRWMCIAEFGIALWLVEAAHPSSTSVFSVSLAVIGPVVGLAALRTWSRSRRLLARGHLGEIKDIVQHEMGLVGLAPIMKETSRGVRVALSNEDSEHGSWHMSLSLPDGRRDLPLLAQLAATAMPGLEPDSGFLSEDWVLHVSGRSGGETVATHLVENLIACTARSSQQRRDAQASRVTRGAYFASGQRNNHG